MSYRRRSARWTPDELAEVQKRRDAMLRIIGDALGAHDFTDHRTGERWTGETFAAAFLELARQRATDADLRRKLDDYQVACIRYVGGGPEPGSAETFGLTPRDADIVAYHSLIAWVMAPGHEPAAFVPLVAAMVAARAAKRDDAAAAEHQEGTDG